MRLPKVVASVALIAVLALVAVTGAAGSFIARDPLIDPTLFHRVASESGTATATFTLDSTLASAATLEPDTALVEPVASSLRERPAGVQRVAPRVVGVVSAATGAPRAGGTAGSGGTTSGGWHHDREASWYGPGLYGNGTACGKTLTTTLLGVAHRTLPCGTMVTFRNPSNGRTISVPVVDRGPYVSGRSWDLTAATCKAISHCYTGPIDWRMG